MKFAVYVDGNVRNICQANRSAEVDAIGIVDVACGESHLVRQTSRDLTQAIVHGWIDAIPFCPEVNEDDRAILNEGSNRTRCDCRG